MFWLAELFTDMWPVWLAWFVGVVVLLHGVLRVRAAGRRPSLAGFARDEAGLSYSLAYVFVVPIYILFLCLVYEASMLLMAKFGTMYAAHAGARSAVVWQSANHVDGGTAVRTERIEQSVLSAMAPFVSSRAQDVIGLGITPKLPSVSQSAQFVAAYKLHETGSSGQNPAGNRPYSRESAPVSVLGFKFANATARTSIEVNDKPLSDLPTAAWPAGEPVKVVVTYKAPMYVPGARKILKPFGLFYEMKSAATLPNETPLSAVNNPSNRPLGIDYRSR